MSLPPLARRAAFFQRALSRRPTTTASRPSPTRATVVASASASTSAQQPPAHRLRASPSSVNATTTTTTKRPLPHPTRQPSLLRTYKTVQEASSRYRSGPFSWRAGLLFLLTGGALVAYFRAEKARLERRRVAEATKGVGKPRVGGEFDLVDVEGRQFTDEDLRGRYALVYFGFSHCPDICPEELDKMAEMVDRVKAATGTGTAADGGGGGGGEGEGGGGKKKKSPLVPVFITCDPARDTPQVLKAYLAEFHPDIVGLTGTWDNVKQACKAYRVYFSTPPDVKPGQDYLVDHSIYFYLMDPEGDFVEAIGRNFTAEQAAKVVLDHVGDWKGRLNRD